MARGKSFHVRVIVVVLAALVVLSCSELRDDELECEEAVQRLANCCPGFAVVVGYCIHEESPGCSNGPTHDPALTTRESRCIRSTSCKGLLAQDVCTRASNALPRGTPGAGSGSVCP
jgi:hypothetical protein